MSAKLARYLGHLKAVIEESQKPVTPDVDSKDVPDITQWMYVSSPYHQTYFVPHPTEQS
jgi:hypothetical protein